MDPEGNQLPDLPEVKPLFYQEELHVCLSIWVFVLVFWTILSVYSLLAYKN